MSDYIKRKDVIHAIIDRFVIPFPGLIDEIEVIPSADVRPVLHAKYVSIEDDGYCIYCSSCHAVQPREDLNGDDIESPAFCYRCGAEMEEETNGKN